MSFLDDPALAICNRCGRSTWTPSEVGTEDRMTQPDGNPCGGLLAAKSHDALDRERTAGDAGGES